MHRYLLFDLDGTLTDPAEGITKCVQYALSYFGQAERRPEELYCYIGPPLPESFETYGGFPGRKRCWRWKNTGRGFGKRVCLKIRFIPVWKSFSGR